MWQLVFIVIGFVFCSESGSDVETRIGEDVNLQCLGISKNDKIFSIVWRQSDGTPYFFCDESTTPCDANTTEHSLGREGDTFISILTIRNASLINEDEYSFTMSTLMYNAHCKVNLKISVPPTELILVDKRQRQCDEVLQDGQLLHVEEKENKTIVCQTRTSVKPAVNLEWLIAKGLNVISEYSNQTQDKQDERLFVSTRTLSFTLNYTSDKDITLGCKVATNSSIDHIETSIYIRNKGETRTNTEISWTSSTESQTFARSDGRALSNAATMTADLTGQTEDGMEKKPWHVIGGGSSGGMLLLVLTTVVYIIRKKNMTIRGLGKSVSTRDATRSRPSQDRGALPTPPADQSSLNANRLPYRQPSPARSFRPAPPIPQDIPMRQMVPVSDDTTGTTSENNRLRGATSWGASARSPAAHSQRELDSDMEYDMLNDMEYDVLNMEYAVVDKTPSKAQGAVPHVYRETTDGSAEYALVSKPKMGKNALQPRFRNTEELDAEFEYAVVDKSHRTGRESVPHVYTKTMSGLEEYAVVNKPKDRNKRQSEVRHTTAPGDFEAEYAVVDKWKKN